jgi:hypothetical protein
MNGDASAPLEAGAIICSAKGCRQPAGWVLAWNNPKLHPPERRKTWLACDEHRASLAGHLDVRGMLREVVPFADWQAAHPPAEPN